MPLKKISENLRKDLNHVFQSDLLNKYFDKIVKSCFSNLISPTSNMKPYEQLASTLKPNEIEELNEIHNLMLMLICEIHSLQLTEIEIKALIDDLTTNKDYTESFTEKYLQFKAYVESPDISVAEMMFNSSIKFKKIIDVKWQMCHNIATKHLVKIRKDIYFITLKVLDQMDQIKELNFKCTFEELLDLVTTLQTACKCISQATDKVDIAH